MRDPGAHTAPWLANPRKSAALPRPAEGCGTLGAGRARWRGTLGQGLWPSKCVFHMPSRLLSVTSSSSTWRRRPRGGAAAAPSAGMSISPHPDFLAPPTGTLCHHAASACQRAAPGMVAAGTCDAPIPRPHSPAPAGAEGHELFPFAASRHRSRSTPSSLATPPLVAHRLCSEGTPADKRQICN